MNLDNLRTVRQLAQRSPEAFSEGAIRWYVFNAKANGRDELGAVVRLGRKVLIDEQKFVQWITTAGSKASRRSA